MRCGWPDSSGAQCPLQCAVLQALSFVRHHPSLAQLRVEGASCSPALQSLSPWKMLILSLMLHEVAEA